MSRTIRASGFALALLLLVPLQCAAATVAPHSLITARVDEAKRVTLQGNVRPEVARSRDLGVVADSLPMNHMQLLLQRSAEQAQALERLIDDLHDPQSTSFHQWLTAAQFGKTYGAAPEDIRTIGIWLQARGFRVNLVYPGATVIDFSGSAGAVRNAFHTEIHQFAAGGARHIANTSDPQIPAALAPAIKGIVSLHDFRPHAQYKRRPKYTFSDNNATEYFVTPADLATIYNFNPVFSQGIAGQGQTIALVEDTDIYSARDWSAFRNAFGLSGYSGKLLQLHPSPGGGASNCADPGINSADAEAILDAEWASAAAPGATIELAACADTNTTFGGLIAVQNLINGSAAPPAIISMSYGECEAYNGATANAAYAAAYQQAVAEGVSVFVSAGDEGAAGCDPNNNGAYNGIAVNGFASTPYNVAVGGTDFADTSSGANSTYWNVVNSSGYGSAKSYVPEIPWNNSCAGSIFLHYTANSIAYGSTGLCNSSMARQYAIDSTGGGSGGPSNCATGSPTFNSSNLISGPGSCRGTAKPSWQTGVVGLANDGVRDLPDVSLFAANGLWSHAYVVCYSDIANSGKSCAGAPSSWPAFGGTSFAAPIMAGVQALINQKAGARQGNPNIRYYRLAANEYGGSGNASCNSSNGNNVSAACIFYDVTQGDIVVNCFGFDCYGSTGTLNAFYYGVLSTSSATNSPAFSATTGWDFATGIGTVNVTNLVNGWSSQ
ncbi:MAG TPA: S53 family peptidase [Rudaea sp.]|jgi:subtilase family serine protease|uniref:S53 family peptidase n=1 Tax=Rudaea sp. TaxID=2136325 RepID=UPI002F95DF5B